MDDTVIFAIPPAIYGSAFWAVPESAPASAFGVLFGDSQKVPRRVPPRVPWKLRSAPGSAPRSAFLILYQGKSTPGSTPWGTPNFPGHSRGHSPGHFLGIPKKHSESTLRSTFGDSPKSTPVNGRRDLNVIFKIITFLTFSLLISEDFWVFLSFLGDRNVKS